MMKPMIAIAGAALALSACTPQHKPPVRTALDCPDREGHMRRQSVAADHRSCVYLTRDGGEVTLQLLDTHGDAAKALEVLEVSLMGQPAAATRTLTAADSAKLSADVERVVTEAMGDAARDAADDGDTNASDPDPNPNPDVDPDPDIKIGREGHNAHVNLPGIHISADDDDANVQVGPIHVVAGDGDATIHVSREVRLRGEALSRDKRGLRATFIYSGEPLAGGYRFVGYEAGGPKTGPLTVAVVRSKKEGRDRMSSDVRSLVRRNGGV